MNEINCIKNYVSFKCFIDRATYKTIPYEKEDRRQTVEKIKGWLEEGIREKLQRGKEDVQDVLPRLLRSCGVKESKLIEVNSVKKVLDAIDRLQVAGQAPQLKKAKPSFIPHDNARNFMKFLFSDQPLSTAFVNWKLVKGLLFQKDEALLKDIRIEFQNYCIKLAKQLNKPQFAGPHEQKLADILIGNLLALYPFFEPDDGDLLALPQKIKGKWELVNYRVNLLQMTPDWKGDPYYACGLVPLEDPFATPHLVFMGTPPPTTRGAVHAEYTDFIPGLSVGESVYQEGQKTVESWVDDIVAITGQKFHIYGQSLGGSLCQILAAHKPDKIGKVFAYNPPSLWKPLLEQYQTKIQSLSEADRPEMNIFCQERDPVYSLGAGWDPSWNVYQVLPKEEPNPYEAHIRAFSGQRVVVLKMTPEDIQSHNVSVARRIYNVAAEIFRVPLFVIKGSALGVQILKHNLSNLVKKTYDYAVLVILGIRKRAPIPGLSPSSS
jgi:pimeloyl-ACP methyl ester carboxylesterase